MRGHEPVLSMRNKGLTPKHVCLSCQPLAAESWRHWPEYMAYAEVEIEPHDVPHRLDLRFLVGLPAVVDGIDAERIGRVARQAKAFGASIVYAVDLSPNGGCVVVENPQEEVVWPN